MFAVMLAASIMEARIEAERFKKLTPEQQAAELRLREVQALERIARANEEIANKKFSLF